MEIEKYWEDVPAQRADAIRTYFGEKDEKLSFHVTSFLKIQDGKIQAADEYWGDDGPVPQWRLEKQFGTPIAPC